MQRTITGALALVLTTGILAACGGSDSTTTEAPAAGSTTAAVATATATTAAATTEAATTTAAATTAAATTAAEPSVLTIQVVDEKPVGGVAKLKVNKGDRIRFVVESDSTQEVHLHGYDVAKDAAPGAPAKFEVKATIEGVFEAELEDPGVQILKLTVEP
jgi:plastocyanin